jgi:hypothetical protein
MTNKEASRVFSRKALDMDVLTPKTLPVYKALTKCATILATK